jgi:predicted RNA-binding Zn ribbon-like protein
MTDMTSPALFLGGHPALDFLNTAYGPKDRRVEVLTDGPALLQWLIGAGMLDADAAARLQRRVNAKSLDSAAVEAGELREWTRRWLERWRAAPNRDYGKELATLNKLLASAVWRPEVSEDDGSLRVTHRVQLDSADGLLAVIASQIASLITAEQPSLVKECAGPDCTLWFVDRTKAHGRMFCSASACGNRAKVAAFRERQRPR